MPSREPTADDFPADITTFEISAFQSMGAGVEAGIVVTCARDELAKTRADIKAMGYCIAFMVGKKE